MSSSYDLKQVFTDFSKPDDDYSLIHSSGLMFVTVLTDADFTAGNPFGKEVAIIFDVVPLLILGSEVLSFTFAMDSPRVAQSKALLISSTTYSIIAFVISG